MEMTSITNAATRELHSASTSIFGSLNSKLERTLSNVIFCGLLMVVVWSAIPYGSAEIWWTSLSEVAIFGLGGLWMIHGFFASTWLVPLHRLLLPLLVLAGFIFLQTLPLQPGTSGEFQALSFDPFETRLAGIKLLSLIVVLGLLLRFATTSQRITWLSYTLVGIGLLSSIIGVFQFLTHRSILNRVLPALEPGIGFAQFFNKNHFAFLAEMTLGLCLGAVVKRRNVSRSTPAIIAVAFTIWIALILCNSRGAILAMLCQLIAAAVIVFFPQRAEKATDRLFETGRHIRSPFALVKLSGRLVCIPLMAVVVMGGAVWVGGDPLVNRMESTRNEISTVRPTETGSRRIDIWRAAWEMFSQHPLLGSGYGAFGVAVTANLRASGKSVPQEAHNEYLEILASGGLVGAGLICWAMGGFLLMAFKHSHCQSTWVMNIRSGSLIGILGVAIHSIVDFGLHITGNALVFTSLIGLVALTNLVKSNEVTSSHQ